MADMELIIKIPEDSYRATCSGSMLPPDVKNVVNAIKDGTPLPVGHGNLIDVDCLREDFKASRRISLAELMKIACIVDHAPIIIKADCVSEYGLNAEWLKKKLNQ